MPRFFCPQPLAVGQLIQLPDTVAHHIQVLRLAQGDPITLFNGDGGEYTAALTEIARRSASAEINVRFMVSSWVDYFWGKRCAT